MAAAPPDLAMRISEPCRLEGESQLITTDGQVAESTRALRDRGAEVSAVLCVIDRSSGDHQVLDDEGVEPISLFRASDLA